MRCSSVVVTALTTVSFTTIPALETKGQAIRGDFRSPGSIAAGAQSPGSAGIVDTYPSGGHYHDHSGHRGYYRTGRYWPGFGYGGYGRRLGLFPFGYGYRSRYRGFRFATPGYLFRSYTGPAYGGPLINWPVLSPRVYGYGPANGYGYSPYNYGVWPYGTSILAPNPVNNQWKRNEINNAWQRMRRDVVDRAVNRRQRAVVARRGAAEPTSAAEQIKSVKLQSQGDAAFKNQNWQRALELYRQAANHAPDDGTALMKTGYALVALGRYVDAVDYFKRALKVDPILARTGPPATEMYGKSRLAWSKHLGQLTAWVDENIRDSDRVLLLGIMLKLNGDPRADELLTDAWQLSGGTAEVVKILLSPPTVSTDPQKAPQPPAADGPVLPDP